MRIAVRQIDARNPDLLAILGADIGLDIAAVLVFRFAIQAALDFFRYLVARQYGDAVEALLPVPDRAIADFLELVGGEALVLGLDFLQAGDIRPRFVKPLQQARQACLDAVDIETGDFHLDGKAGAATTTRSRIGIGHLKGAATKGFDKIHRASAHQIEADLVDYQGHARFMNRDIVILDAVGESETILETGTAPAFDGQPQYRGSALLAGNHGDALCGIGGQDDILFDGCKGFVHMLKIGTNKRSGKP